MARYHWSRPGQYPVEAQVVGETLERLPARDPQTIVASARSRRSPLHKLFEWDATRAAERYRLLQAQLMLGALQIDVVVYKRKKQETISVRAVVRTSRAGTYDSIHAAMSEPSSRDFVLSQALAQIQAWKRRYGALSEVAVICAAIDDVASRTKKRRAN